MAALAGGVALNKKKFKAIEGSKSEPKQESKPEPRTEMAERTQDERKRRSLRRGSNRPLISEDENKPMLG